MGGVDFGFTGSEQGMTKGQMDAFINWTTGNKDLLEGGEFHHGMCVGADAEAHKFFADANEQDDWNIKIVGHPAFPQGHSLRGVEDFQCDQVWPIVKDPLDRYLEIVTRVWILLACPEFPGKESESWTAVRYAKTAKVPLLVFGPVMGDSGGWWPR